MTMLRPTGAKCRQRRKVKLSACLRVAGKRVAVKQNVNEKNAKSRNDICVLEVYYPDYDTTASAGRIFFCAPDIGSGLRF